MSEMHLDEPMSIEFDADVPRRVARTKEHLRFARIGRRNSVPRYILKAPDGRYVHFSGQGLTDNRAWAWVGPKTKITALRRRLGLPPGLEAVEVEP